MKQSNWALVSKRRLFAERSCVHRFALELGEGTKQDDEMPGKDDCGAWRWAVREWVAGEGAVGGGVDFWGGYCGLAGRWALPTLISSLVAGHIEGLLWQFH
eukprot:12128545-Ditylum_brightwellii.AAC.1